MNAVEALARQSWQTTDLFEIYEGLRQYTRPILRKTTRDIIVPNIPKGGIVVEHGAGAGELRHNLLGKSIKRGVTWHETDQNQTYLDLPRKFATDKVQATLPNFPFDDDYANLSIGYGVLDTIPAEKLPEALEELHRVCKEGGKLIEFLDLYPDVTNFIASQFSKGKIPFRAIGEIAPGIRGLIGHYIVDKAKLEATIGQWEASSSMKIKLRVPMFKLYAENPLLTMGRLEQREQSHLLNDLGEQVVIAGLVEDLVSPLDLYQESLGEAASSSGFQIERSENITDEIVVPKDDLPPLYKPGNELIVINGREKIRTNPDIPKNKVRVEVSQLVFIARKGLEA